MLPFMIAAKDEQAPILVTPILAPVLHDHGPLNPCFTGLVITRSVIHHHDVLQANKITRIGNDIDAFRGP